MKKILGVMLCLFLLTGCSTSHLEDGKESVVQFEDGGISAQDLYEKLKEENGLNSLITLMDTELLSREYKEDNEEKTYIKQVIDGLKDRWGESFDSNIKTYYNVSDEDGLEEYIRLDYRRDKWTDDYAVSQVNDTQLSDYEENYLVGDMEVSHILITSKASSSASADEKEKAENDAYNKAQEVINRLNNGDKFEDLSKELNEDNAVKDNGGRIPEKINDRSSYDQNFLDAAIKLEVGKYSSTPVKSSFGYHIIYKTSQGEKPSLDSVKDEVKKKIAQDTIDSDSSYSTKAIIALREKYGFKITDTDLKKAYEDIESVK